MLNILLIGSGAREHAIARAVKRSAHKTNLFCLESNNNPGIRKLSAQVLPNPIDFSAYKIDFAIIGPEAALAEGVVDRLASANIPSVGPTKLLAQIETSKSFTRELMAKYNINASPKHKIFHNMYGVKNFIQELNNNFVIKADGLKGGKGVKISGEHVHKMEDALTYCRQLISEESAFIIEEKLAGEEFSLLSFCDGKTLLHMPPIRDYKRAFVGNKGPNTGGMGSYSLENHLLPFLAQEDVKQAQEFNTATITALHEEFSAPYKGIIYGGYILTKYGVKLIEYNARFGDPEAINILALLKTDFVDICNAIINGTLEEIKGEFYPKATVCKYIVPEGYPTDPVETQEIDISAVKDFDNLYYAAVTEENGKLYTGRSRSIAVIGIANNITKAEQKAENMAKKIKGPVFHREDVGVKLLCEN